MFNPDENSKIQIRKRLNKKTIEIFLNKLFVLDDQETNEAIIRQYANKKKYYSDIKANCHLVNDNCWQQGKEAKKPSNLL